MPGNRVRSGVDRGVSEVLGDPMLGDPPGDALAHRHPQLVGRLVDVLADLTDHRDREELVAGDPVDADVVIVDQLPELGRDREPDLIDLAQPVEPRTQLLDRLELGRPRRHPVVVLRGADRHAGLRCELCHGLELVLRPLVGPVVVDVQHAEELPAIEQRSDADRVEALADDVCPDVGSARIVPIADGEEWPAGSDRPPCQ